MLVFYLWGCFRTERPCFLERKRKQTRGSASHPRVCTSGTPQGFPAGKGRVGGVEAQGPGPVRAGSSVLAPTAGPRGKRGVRGHVWEACGLETGVTQETGRRTEVGQGRGTAPESPAFGRERSGEAVLWATGRGEELFPL